MPTRTEQAQQKAVDILKKEPNGKHYSELLREIQETTGIKKNTVQGALAKLDSDRKEEVYKHARGLFRHTDFREETPVSPPPETQIVEKVVKVDPLPIREDVFYESFADYLTHARAFRRGTRGDETLHREGEALSLTYNNLIRVDLFSQ
jgi:hypothetical protein